MTEPKDVTFELNVFGEEPRCHLKLTGPGTPPLEFVVSAFKRLDDAEELWAATRPARDMARAQRQGVTESPEPPPDESHEASKPRPARPSPGPAVRNPSEPASKKQLGMIKGMCEKVDDQVVVATFKKFENFDGAYNDDGHYIPSWDFLNELTKGEAHFAIDGLKKFE